MSAHPFPQPVRPRRSGALVLVLVMIAVPGALIAAPALAADGATARAGLTQADPGVVQPEPPAPQIRGGGPSPLAVGIVVVVAIAMTAAAGFAAVSRRRGAQ